MAITAALAQTSFAADIFSHRVIHEPAGPALPSPTDSIKAGSHDTTNPVSTYINELVCVTAKVAAFTC